MQINEYQALAFRTASSEMSEDCILNGVLGLCGESGEVSDHVKKHLFQGHDLDEEKMIDEIGDVCWYIALLASGLNVSLEEIMTRNIEKLERRYPDGFSTHNSINRKDVE